MAIEDKIIKPIKIYDICVPSDILTDCENIYKKFKKMYDKYAPGKLAFFKFNSTIVDNLDKLKNSEGCTNLYKISVYRSYFRDCNNKENIFKTTDKILSKLDSLLEAIGTSKKASLSTLGVKGLFTKKRNYDGELNELYGYFEKLKNGMRTTINDNRVDTNCVDCMQGFKFISYKDTDKHQLIQEFYSDSNKKAMDIGSLLNNVKIDNLEITYLKCKNVNDIPSYAEVMNNFLNNSIIEYNNLYKIQHNFNKLYGLKGSKHSYLNDNKSFKEISGSFLLTLDQLSGIKGGLSELIDNLNDAHSKFLNSWKNQVDKSVKPVLENISKLQTEMEKLLQQIKNSNQFIKGKFFDKINSSENKPNYFNSYYDLIGDLSNKKTQTRTNIKILTSVKKYEDILNKLSAITKGLNIIKTNIAYFPKVGNTTQNLDFNEIHQLLLDYNKRIKNTEIEFKQFYRDATTLIAALGSNEIKIKEEFEEENFKKLMNKVSAIGTMVGVPLALLSKQALL